MRARRRANSSIARLNPPYRSAAHWNVQKLSAKTLTRWAPTVLTSQPAHKLGVASALSSRPSRRSAMRRRSTATASNISARSMRRLGTADADAPQGGVASQDQRVACADLLEDVLRDPLLTDDAPGQHIGSGFFAVYLAGPNTFGQ